MSKSKSEPSSKAECLVAGNSLIKIPYSDKPLAQGGEIIYLTPEEFKTTFNCTYTESLFGDSKAFSKYINNMNLCAQIKSNPDLPAESLIKERLKQPLDSFVICKINDEVGYGLFAKRDIPPGTVLFLYSGMICEGREFSEGDDYQFNWIQNTTTATDASQIGGLSRFMQHLPMDYQKHRDNLRKGITQRLGNIIIEKKIELESFLDEMMSQVKDNEINEINFNNQQTKLRLAHANVNIMTTVINGVPITICISLYDGIKKNEQIGFSYGSNYWACKSRLPRFFMDNGELIPLKEYHHKQDLTLSNNNNTILRNLNPLVNYKTAIELYKTQKYNIAIKHLDIAIEGFVNKKSETSLEVLNCYSAYASCFREMALFNKASKAIEKAIEISIKLNSKEQESLLQKHQQILLKSGSIGIEIYQQAVIFYKDKQFIIAMNLLQLSLTKFEEEKTPQDKKAICYSTISSCYRDMGEIGKALESINIAIALCQKTSFKKECESKLEKLLILQDDNIINSSKLDFTNG